MQIYHNPRCRKSRETLAILENKGIEAEIVLYLEKPPSKKELKEIIQKLGMSPGALVRKSEAIFRELFKGKTLTDAQWISAMVEHPKLIERPIVIKGKRAIIGRPPEAILELF